MKTSIKITLSLGLLITATLLSGCASQCDSCRPGLFGGNRILQNQPIRSTVRSWFQGDDCDTCNTPAGQVYTPNVAPLCESCNTGQAAPLYGNPVDVQLQSPQLNGGLGPAGLSNGMNAPQGM